LELSAAAFRILKNILAAQLREEQHVTVQSPLPASRIHLRKGPSSGTFHMLCWLWPARVIARLAAHRRAAAGCFPPTAP